MVVNNLEVSGGYQKLVIRLAQNLQVLGHEVITYTPALDTKNCYPEEINSIKVVSLKPVERVGTMVDQYQRLCSKITGEFQSLIIHDELSLISVALLAKRKTIWMLNNQLPETLGKYSPELRSAFGQKNMGLKHRWNDTKEARRRIKLMRAGLKRVDYFAVYDRFNANLVKKYLHREADIVYAGADLERFSKLGAGRKFSVKKRLQVLSVGVIFPHRRYEDLIKATALAKKAGVSIKTVIVGRQDLSPEYFKQLKTLRRGLELDKDVLFINYVSDADMLEHYKKSDIFAFINDGFTWGIAVFEAVAAKLPVIISDNIGAVDLIKPNKTGWVVKPRSPKAVALSIQAIANEPAAAKKIAETAFNDISKIVSWREYAKRMEVLLKR